MTKFKQNFFTDFEQATKNDKKEYTQVLKSFLIEILMKNFKKVPHQGS